MTAFSPRRASRLLLAGLFCGASLIPREAAAHAFGARYDLPLPFEHYVFGAAAVLLLSFAIAAAGPRFLAGRGLRLSAAWPLPKVARLIGQTVGILGVTVFLLIVATGLFGAGSPTTNIAPLLVWVIWWVGFLFFCAFAVNIWPLLDPWRRLFSWVKAKVVGERGAPEGPPRLGYRSALGAWPAVLLFFLFAWMELVGEVGETPRLLAWIVIGYSALAWGGMALFGKAVWLSRCDPFARVFGLFGRFAPLAWRSGAPRQAYPAGLAVIRFPGAGLLGDAPRDLSEVVFVLLVLSSVAFDGFSETPLWTAILDSLANSRDLRPVLLWLSRAGVDLLGAITTLALMLAPLLFLAVYASVCWVSARLGGGGVSCGQVLRSFALTLLPIAIAYHLSHYLSYLLLAGQMLAPMASDPFGFGWDLLGTANMRIDLSVINAKTVWIVALIAIVSGHVLSVVLAHIEALRLFPNSRRAFWSQVPMLVLMVAFTGCSLWILAQPVVQ